MAQNTNLRKENQTLWRISGNDLGSPSYLLVTLHSQDKRAFEFSDSTIMAFDQCDAFAVVIDHDSFEMAIFDQFFQEKGPNKTLSYILTEAQYRNVSKKLFERTGHTLDQTQISNPALLGSLLRDDPSGYGNSDYSIRPQEYFIRTAKAKNKKIVSLESLQDLVSMNLYTESEISDLLLIAPYSDYYYSPEQRSADSAYSEYILQMYKEGNIDAIQQKLMMSKSAQRELSAHNRIIFNNLQHEIAMQSVFICLDLSSVAGPDGVLNLLKAYGYTLEAVNATYTGIADNYAYKPDNIPWVPVNSDKYGYSVEFPVKVKSPGNKSLLNDFYRVFDDGANLIYSVMSTRQASSRSASDEELLSEFIQNDWYLSKFKDNLNQKKISTSYKEQIIHGLELEIKDNQRARRATRVQIFIRDKQYFYVLMAESYEKNTVVGQGANRFFKSFILKELPKIEAAQTWKKITVKDLSFSFASLGDPDTKEQLYEATDSSSGKSITYTFFDHKDGSSYYLRCNNPGKNNNEDRYSIYEFENNLSYKKGVKIISKTDLNDSIFVGREYITDEGTTNGLIRLFYRGSRSYLMIIQHPKEGYDSLRIQYFINSFELLQPQAAELSLYTAKNKEYSLLLPQQPDLRMNKIKDRFSVLDPKSSVTFELSKENISAYKHYPSEDSMRRQIIARFIEIEDSLFSCDTLSNYAPYDAYEWTIRKENSFGLQRIRMLYVGNVIYILKAFVAPADLHYSLIDSVFNSFRFKNAAPNPRPILPERDSVVAILFRELPEKLKEPNFYSGSDIRLSFVEFPFIASDFPYFSNAIKAVSEKDSLALDLFKLYFNAIPKNADINSLIPFLQQAYNGDFIEKKNIKIAILALLSRYPNTETKACFKELLLKNVASPLNEFKSNAFYHFDSPLGLYKRENVKEAAFLFPEILTLLNKDNMQPWMLSLFGNALDSAIISIEDLSIYLPDFEKQFLKKSEILSKTNKEMVFHDEYDIIEILSVLKHLKKPSSRIQKRLEELLRNEKIFDFNLRYVFIEALLMYKLKPNQEMVMQFCSDRYVYRYILYCMYKAKGMEKFFPKSWLDQKDMAMAKLASAIEFEEHEIFFITKENIEIDGKTGIVYVFKLTRVSGANDDNKEWQLAAVGFYSDEQDLIGDPNINAIIEQKALDTKKGNIDTEKKALLEKFRERYKAK